MGKRIQTIETGVRGGRGRRRSVTGPVVDRSEVPGLIAELRMRAAVTVLFGVLLGGFCAVIQRLAYVFGGLSIPVVVIGIVAGLVGLAMVVVVAVVAERVHGYPPTVWGYLSMVLYVAVTLTPLLVHLLG